MANAVDRHFSYYRICVIVSRTRLKGDIFHIRRGDMLLKVLRIRQSRPGHYGEARSHLFTRSPIKWCAISVRELGNISSDGLSNGYPTPRLLNRAAMGFAVMEGP